MFRRTIIQLIMTTHSDLDVQDEMVFIYYTLLLWYLHQISIWRVDSLSMLLPVVVKSRTCLNVSDPQHQNHKGNHAKKIIRQSRVHGALRGLCIRQWLAVNTNAWHGMRHILSEMKRLYYWPLMSPSCDGNSRCLDNLEVLDDNCKKYGRRERKVRLEPVTVENTINSMHVVWL